MSKKKIKHYKKVLRYIDIYGIIDISTKKRGRDMFLRKLYIKKTGRTYLSMVHGYWDKAKGHSRTKTIESFGYVDELQKTYGDPIEHFTKVVEERNHEEELVNSEYIIKANKNQTIPQNTSGRMNYGYIAILKLFYELGLEQFLINKKRTTKIEYNTGAIMKLLVISRILSPGSKKKAFDERERYFDFEIDKEDDLKAKGVSKEHRPDPIVQMGLALDEEGLPISYELFPGNESEKLHLRPMILELKQKYVWG